MSDYIKQLEEQNEQLKETLARCHLYWKDGPNKGQKHLRVGRCTIAQYFEATDTYSKKTGMPIIIATVYATSDCDRYESKDDCETIEEAKEWIYTTIFGDTKWMSHM